MKNKPLMDGGGLCSFRQRWRSDGEKERCRPKGTALHKKEKERGRTEVPPLHGGKKQGKKSCPYTAIAKSRSLASLGMTEGDFSGICQEDFGASDLGGSGFSAGFSAGLSLSDGFASGCFTSP